MKRIRSSAVVVHENRVLLVKLEDPVTKEIVLSPPGGGVEEGETAAETAIRETREETGYDVELISKGRKYIYDFTWKQKVYHCETTFFLAKLANPSQPPSEVDDEDINVGFEWVALERVSDISSHDIIERAIRETIDGN